MVSVALCCCVFSDSWAGDLHLDCDPACAQLPSLTPLLLLDSHCQVRAQAGFPNVTDSWGQRLCSYYQDVCWGTPESGVVLWAAAKGLMGLSVAPGGSLSLAGTVVNVSAGPGPWTVSSPVPPGWPPELATVKATAVAVAGLSVDVSCTVEPSAGSLLACSVEQSSAPVVSP